MNEAKAFYFILAAAVPKEAVFRKAFKGKVREEKKTLQSGGAASVSDEVQVKGQTFFSCPPPPPPPPEARSVARGGKKETQV